MFQPLTQADTRERCAGTSVNHSSAPFNRETSQRRQAEMCSLATCQVTRETRDNRYKPRFIASFSRSSASAGSASREFPSLLRISRIFIRNLHSPRTRPIGDLDGRASRVARDGFISKLKTARFRSPPRGLARPGMTDKGASRRRVRLSTTGPAV